MSAVQILDMNYVSLTFYCLLVISLLLYYILPHKFQVGVLLCTSIIYYVVAMPSMKHILMFVTMILINYIWGLVIEKAKGENAKKLRLLTVVGCICSAFPFAFMRLMDLLYGSILRRERLSFIVPLGLAFFSMQMVAYLVDVSKGGKAEKNIFRHFLFMSFFPTIVQGPILRYEKMAKELFLSHKIEIKNIIYGFRAIIWGFFLKYMIADKAGVYVDHVFDNYLGYAGLYVLIAAVLYSVQLYTDFYSCVLICRGVALLYGISLPQNFNHPYFSRSIGEFWSRWHISLSSWLRDYVYIPLGGNRKGRIRKYSNLMVTFLISGLWHGGSLNYIFWGLMHAVYQIVHDFTKNMGKMKDSSDEKIDIKIMKTLVTFFLVMLGWIVFRAESLSIALHMIEAMFKVFNPWILFDGGIMSLGLDAKDWNVLLLSMLTLLYVEKAQFKNNYNLDKVSLPSRIVLYCVLIFVIAAFGTYGADYATQNFIYGGF